jgi:hypothetical protein
MKTYQKALRVWIAIASVFSFLGGWVLLAHSPKPVPPTNTNVINLAPLPTLPPIQGFGLGSGNGSGLSPFIPNNQPSSGVPLLRTGGS